jgi:hypothetical protein
MPHAQNFDNIRAQAIGHDVGCSADDQRAGPAPPAGPTEFRELKQSDNRGERTPNLPVRRRWIVVSDIGPRGSQIGEDRPGPD